MSKTIDIFVVYQENGLSHEKIVELPAGLSNTDCIEFIRTQVGESANILNMINIDMLNRQKIAHPELPKPGLGASRPERRSDARPRFGGESSRPYGASRGGFSGRDSGGFGGREGRPGPRDTREGRPSSRDATRGGRDSGRPSGFASRAGGARTGGGRPSNRGR